MIDVGDMKLKSPEGSKLRQRMQEDNAVYAAAHANDHRLEVISQRPERIFWRWEESVLTLALHHQVEQRIVERQLAFSLRFHDDYYTPS